MVLLALKALAGGKVELAAAIGTKQKPGEQSLPFRFCGAALVFCFLRGQEVRLVLCFRDFGKNPISFFLFSQKVLETTGKYCIM